MSGKNLETKNTIERDEIREGLDLLKQEVSEDLYGKPEQIEGRNLYEELKNFNFEQIFEYPQGKDKGFKRIKPGLEKEDEYGKYIEINGEKYYDFREIRLGSNTKYKNERIFVYTIRDSKYGSTVLLNEIDEKCHICGTGLVYGMDGHITSMKSLYYSHEL